MCAEVFFYLSIRAYLSLSNVEDAILLGGGVCDGLSHVTTLLFVCFSLHNLFLVNYVDRFVLF